MSAVRSHTIRSHPNIQSQTGQMMWQASYSCTVLILAYIDRMSIGGIDELKLLTGSAHVFNEKRVYELVRTKMNRVNTEPSAQNV
ncbi:hypothetical protein RG959_00745 [Domibacillus sp. 8LH]|uniref:hypothetical protein n=1 Tax=Domibacillus sp. 8LH TaxID=3073900 RepID=UPI003170F235